MQFSSEVLNMKNKPILFLIRFSTILFILSFVVNAISVVQILIMSESLTGNLIISYIESKMFVYSFIGAIIGLLLLVLGIKLSQKKKG